MCPTSFACDRFRAHARWMHCLILREAEKKKKIVLRNTTNLTIPLLLCDGE